MATDKTTNQSDALQGMQLYLTKDDKANSLDQILAYLNQNKQGRRYRLIITHNGVAFEPPIKGEITLELERFGTPGKLSFTTVKSTTQNMGFQEGDRVIFCVADKKADGSLSDYRGMYVGYVFQKHRDKQHHIEVTCYDQTRYLKNRFSYVFENKTATEVIKSICADYGLKVGELEDTKYQIPCIAEENAEGFDVILIALEETLANTGEMYVFYDDAGTLLLRNAANMKSDVLVEADTAEDFDYETSIDKETYNSVVLYYKPQTVAQTASGESTVTDDNGVTMDNAYFSSAGATNKPGAGGINVVSVISWARAQLGKSAFVRRQGDTIKTLKHCAAFVNTAFYHGGARDGFMEDPNSVVNKWVIKGSKGDGNPPLGACVFFEGSSIKPGAGRKYGHIGISLGNGTFIHAVGTVEIRKLNINATGYLAYKGWGWFNKINLGTNAVKSSGKSSSSTSQASNKTGSIAGTTAGSMYSALTQVVTNIPKR